MGRLESWDPCFSLFIQPLRVKLLLGKILEVDLSFVSSLQTPPLKPEQHWFPETLQGAHRGPLKWLRRDAQLLFTHHLFLRGLNVWGNLERQA